MSNSVVGIIRDDFQGYFMGFFFNGRHSSEFGITRVSTSNRYEEKLLPTFKDKTVEVPGGDGTYYFGSYYTQKPFQINIAFDSMSRHQFDEMSEWLGDRGIHELIFDETDYKAYSVKCTGTPSLKYLCFDTSEGDVYKGEGTINFVAYYPFAHSRDFTNKIISLIDDSIENAFEDQDGLMALLNVTQEELANDYTLFSIPWAAFRNLSYSTIYFFISLLPQAEVWFFNYGKYKKQELDVYKFGLLANEYAKVIAFDYEYINNKRLIAGHPIIDFGLFQDFKIAWNGEVIDDHLIHDRDYEKEQLVIVLKTHEWHQIRQPIFIEQNFPVWKFFTTPFSGLDFDFVANINIEQKNTPQTLQLLLKYDNGSGNDKYIFEDELDYLLHLPRPTEPDKYFIQVNPENIQLQEYFIYKTAEDVNDDPIYLGVLQLYSRFQQLRKYRIYNQDPNIVDTIFDNLSSLLIGFDDVKKITFEIPANTGPGTVIIDSKKQLLIFENENGVQTVQNNWITEGTFFKINGSVLKRHNLRFELNDGTNLINNNNWNVSYHFLYY